jgi:hypothetical protein
VVFWLHHRWAFGVLWPQRRRRNPGLVGDWSSNIWRDVEIFVISHQFFWGFPLVLTCKGHEEKLGFHGKSGF